MLAQMGYKNPHLHTSSIVDIICHPPNSVCFPPLHILTMLVLPIQLTFRYNLVSPGVPLQTDRRSNVFKNGNHKYFYMHLWFLFL